MKNNQPLPTPMPTNEKKGCSPILVVILAVLAIGGIGFGIFEMLNKKPETAVAECSHSDCLITKNQDTESRSQNAELENQNTPSETTNPGIDISKTEYPKDYLVIEEWNLKIKIPDGLNIFYYH